LNKVLLPKLGEGIEKAVVSFWFFKEGDAIKANDDLVELTTDKAAFNLPSPCAGKLSQIIFHEGDTVNVGETLCIIEE
jgi:pyruvate/2-oxoglutarate dehydrogenase complex dihydrolipoamide acyltransferase (E2) component